MVVRKLASTAVVGVLVAGLAISGRPLIAHAVTFTVNSLLDTHDAHPGDGICADATGKCTLRAAIDETNSLVGASGITLPAGTYHLVNPGFNIASSNLTITGAGASITVIDAGSSATVGTPITVAPGAGLNISGVTIENGLAASGGAMSNGGTLTVDSSSLSGDSASMNGGAIANSGVLVITNSHFFNDTVTQSFGGGGAIWNQSGSLTVTASTIDHNSSAGLGGGVATQGAVGTTTITNSTISYNSASQDGGGVWVWSDAVATISNTTIASNAASTSGGGIRSFFGAGVQIKNTIVSGNTASSAGTNCAYDIPGASQGYNLDSGTSCGFHVTGDLSNMDPMLGPLQDNGGPTPTQALSPGSPAIDTGSPNCPPPQTDQRGSPRPIGRGCDIGAFEYLPPPRLVLPAVMHGAYGGYTTTLYVQNIGTAAAGISILYYDQSGNRIGSGDFNVNVPPHATWIVSQVSGTSFPIGQAGSALIYSTQPVASFVNEFAPGGSDGSSYTAIPWLASGPTTVFAPAIANRAYGGYTTGIGLINLASSPTNLTIIYRDASGSVAKTQTLNAVPAGAFQGLYSGDATLALPDGFAGTATITSSVGTVAAIVNETGPGGQFSSYDAAPGGSTALFAPAALNHAYGGYNTGMGIQNTAATAGSVSINYYDAGGVATTTTRPIAANGYLGVYQGTDIPVAGAYTAKLTSTVPIAAIVNEIAPTTGPAQQSTSYNTIASGSAASALPLVENAGPDGWSTGEGIMNTGSSTTTVTITYYDQASGGQLVAQDQQILQPNAFWGLYQPNGGLANWTMRATAVVTTSAGGTVAVICNESNSASFMSYAGQ